MKNSGVNEFFLKSAITLYSRGYITKNKNNVKINFGKNKDSTDISFSITA